MPSAIAARSSSSRLAFAAARRCNGSTEKTIFSCPFGAKQPARTCQPSRGSDPFSRVGGRLDRDAGELFDGRQARGDLRQAVVPERAHAVRQRGALELLAARLRRRETLQRVYREDNLLLSFRGDAARSNLPTLKGV